MDSSSQLERLESDIQLVVDESWVNQVRAALADEFGAVVTSHGLQGSLWSSILVEADDPDARALPEWIANGFPWASLATLIIRVCFRVLSRTLLQWRPAD